MRRLLTLLPLLFVAGACTPGPAAPPAPAPPSELLFIPGPAMRVVAARDGSLVATLPEGAFDALLSGGGDVAEAYVVGAGVHRIRPGRPFRDDRTADATGRAPYQAALVGAPGLTTFVGQKTVLVTLSADGQLAGYQAGTRIWTRAAPGATELRRLDTLVAVRVGDDWSRVVPENGALTSLASGCPQGPIADQRGQALMPCPSSSTATIAGVPPGVPYVLHPVGQDVTVLAWPDGQWIRLGQRGSHRAGAGGGRPALAPDGSRLFWPAGYPPATAMATSRDGNFLYALGGGRLRVFAAGAAHPLGDFAAEGSDIALVSGG